MAGLVGLSTPARSPDYPGRDRASILPMAEMGCSSDGPRHSPALSHTARAIVLQAIWAAVLVATGSYRALFTRSDLHGMDLSCGWPSVSSGPSAAGYAPAYRVWLYPALPVLFAVSALAVALNQMASNLAVSSAGSPDGPGRWPIYHFFLRPRTGDRLRMH